MSADELAPIAALACSVIWAGAILTFSGVIRDFGSFRPNLFKAAFGGALFLVTATVTGDLAEAPRDGRVYSLLFVSGVLGMGFGDYALFASMARIGAQRANILHATNPLMVLLWTISFDGRVLAAKAALGIILMVAGTIDVIASRRSGSTRRADLSGLIWGLGAAAGQASGLLLQENALDDCPITIAASLRLFAGALTMVVAAVAAGRARALRAAFTPEFMRRAAPPTLAGTYVGVLLMTWALKTGSQPAVTSGLLSLAPVFLVPFLAWRRVEPFRWRSMIGVSVAIAGVLCVVTTR